MFAALIVMLTGSGLLVAAAIGPTISDRVPRGMVLALVVGSVALIAGGALLGLRSSV